MNIELYIDQQLCDLEKADLGIRLRRQLFNPKELSTKDSQKSYSITLPCTPRNNEIFHHKNVEETVGKFAFYPDARLYVDNILIMEGKFRLSSISSEGYKGNLGVPVPLTAKDVFGERKMNDIGSWALIDFKGEKSISAYNKYPAEGEEPKPCIFPLVLYGLLPNTDTASISQGTTFTLDDFPPSINCIQMLRKIFINVGYTLTGTALTDERLKQLYVSYKNPEDYPLPFEVKRTEFSAKWTNWIRTSIKNQMEKQISVNSFPNEYSYIVDNEENIWNGGEGFVACNLFKSDNLSGVNIINNESHHLKYSNGQVSYKVPSDGLYRIDLDASIFLKDEVGNSRIEHSVDGKTVYVINRTFTAYNDKLYRSFDNLACELKLIRHSDSTLDLSSITMDNMFSRKNQDQDNTLAGKLNRNAYFPLPGNVNFVDAAQNKDFLCGFSWGRMTSHNGNWTRGKGQNYALVEFDNPLWEEDNRYIAQPMAIKHGKSWIPGEGVSADDLSQSAVYSPGYVKVGENNQVIEPEESRYKVELEGAQAYAELNNMIVNGQRYAYVGGKGRIQQMVWLRAGENISLVICQNRSNRLDWIHQDVEFTLSIEPFKNERDWLTMYDTDDKSNNSSAPMHWGDTTNLLRDQIDLTKFLPREVKIDDWITNFCKAFNLELIHTGDKSFALNVKEQDIVKNTSLVIDLDQKTSVYQATNDTLALPRAYKLGFTTDTAEEGYVASISAGKDMTEGNTGGGLFETGSNEANQIEQTSNFSYCWYKTLAKNYGDKKAIDVPVITDHEIWVANDSATKNKTYLNKAQRFWFHSGRTEELNVYETPAKIALVDEVYRGKKDLWLNYHDKPDSIMREYFTLLTNDKEYTCVECHLTAEEYNMLDKAFIRFNGDLYNVVDADGFDPLGKSKTKLKLIKKM